MISCRPYVFHDLMMSLPDFVKHFFPDLPLEKSREMLQEILKVRIIKNKYVYPYTFLEQVALHTMFIRLCCTRATLATRRC